MRYTLKTYELMKYIYDEMPRNMSMIARGLDRHRAAVSRSVHSLMDAGYVERTKSGMFVITHAGALEMIQMQDWLADRVTNSRNETAKIEAVWEP